MNGSVTHNFLFIGVARIFQRGGDTVTKWEYSPDCHVDLHAVFLIKKKKSKKSAF